MDQKAADELIGGQLHDLLAITGLDAVILPAERDCIGVGADQAGVRDRHAVSVTAEIGQHRLRAAERRLGVDHPFSFAERGQPGGECAGIGQSRSVTEEDQVSGVVEGEQACEEYAAKEPR